MLRILSHLRYIEELWVRAQVLRLYRVIPAKLPALRFQNTASQISRQFLTISLGIRQSDMRTFRELDTRATLSQLEQDLKETRKRIKLKLRAKGDIDNRSCA